MRIQESPKWRPVVLKLLILNYFESIELSPPINIEQRHIHRICVKLFRGINYTKNTVEMTLFQNYEVFVKKNDDHE